MAEPQQSRRKFIQKTAAAGAGCLLLGAFSSCASEPEKAMGTLAELEAQGFLTVRFNGSKAHARFLNDELVVFSQKCRHKKCTVRWEKEEKAFYCPCHEGTYDAEGNVISGPPQSPLRRFMYEMRGDTVYVLNEYAER